MLARITGGRATRQTSRSCQETTARTMNEKTSSRVLVTNMSRPNWTSSCSDSTSEVIRDTTTPAFSRS